MRLRNRIIWNFGHGLNCTNRFSGRYESILWFTKSNDYYFNLDAVRVGQKYPWKRHAKGHVWQGDISGNPLGKNPGNVWDISNVKASHGEKTDHPCQFPVALVERLILSMTKENDLVVDPYMGSGTTAVAALKNNRRVAGAEQKRRYIQIIKDRIQSLEDGSLKVVPIEDDLDRTLDFPITPNEAGHYLGICGRTVRRMLARNRRGELTGGNHYKIDKETYQWLRKTL